MRAQTQGAGHLVRIVAPPTRPMHREGTDVEARGITVAEDCAPVSSWLHVVVSRCEPFFDRLSLFCIDGVPLVESVNPWCRGLRRSCQVHRRVEASFVAVL